MRHSMRLRFLQQGKDLLPLHTGKTFEKVCNGVTGLKMVKQTLNRYPGPGKDRFASENFRRALKLPGMRGAMIGRYPSGGEVISPADDPFWAGVAAAGVPLDVHVSFANDPPGDKR